MLGAGGGACTARPRKQTLLQRQQVVCASLNGCRALRGQRGGRKWSPSTLEIPPAPAKQVLAFAGLLKYLVTPWWAWKRLNGGPGLSGAPLACPAWGGLQREPQAGSDSLPWGTSSDIAWGAANFRSGTSRTPTRKLVLPEAPFPLATSACQCQLVLLPPC